MIVFSGSIKPNQFNSLIVVQSSINKDKTFSKCERSAPSVNGQTQAVDYTSSYLKKCFYNFNYQKSSNKTGDLWGFSLMLFYLSLADHVLVKGSLNSLLCIN